MRRLPALTALCGPSANPFTAPAAGKHGDAAATTATRGHGPWRVLTVADGGAVVVHADCVPTPITIPGGYSRGGGGAVLLRWAGKPAAGGHPCGRRGPWHGRAAARPASAPAPCAGGGAAGER